MIDFKQKRRYFYISSIIYSQVLNIYFSFFIPKKAPITKAIGINKCIGASDTSFTVSVNPRRLLNFAQAS
ncbi:hypothetical protein GCM10010832_18100 [Psychroflexus planctonicus]|uniref:Uncharacterized protein n=1 Tax=Psychroflexus planctonicus TaxID=1526575 RepID=A0ABQ1SJU0_9FLAO|nr:hypothetical protein GCM10010832_18100 [Psychroflexus planctonicus]